MVNISNLVFSRVGSKGSDEEVTLRRSQECQQFQYLSSTCLTENKRKEKIIPLILHLYLFIFLMVKITTEIATFVNS